MGLKRKDKILLDMNCALSEGVFKVIIVLLTYKHLF